MSASNHSTRKGYALVAAVLLAVLGLTGCGPRKNYGAHAADLSWIAVVPDSVPGIDEFSISFVTLKVGSPDGLPFVVWSDLPNETAGSGEGTVRGASYAGHHADIHGHRVDFHASTTNGITGSLTIAGIDYDLAKGSMLLVAARQDPLKVVQMTYNLATFPQGVAFKGGPLRNLANANPEIRDFFQKRSKGEK